MVWDGIRPINESMACDICGSDKDVQREKLQSMTSGTTGPIPTGSYTQSNLCKNCADSGWMVLTTYFRLEYINRNTNKIRKAKRTSTHRP